MSMPKSRFEGLFEPSDKQPDQIEPVGVPPINDTSEEPLKERNKDKKKARKQEGTLPRIKTNYEIRQDYVRALKRIAVDEGRKIYEVMEEALGEYLERHRRGKLACPHY